MVKILYLFLLFSQACYAEMAASYDHKIKDVITELKKNAQGDVYEMALLADQVFEVKIINNYDQRVSFVSLPNIIVAIRQIMDQDPAWRNKLSQAKVKMLESKQDLLQRSFGQNSHEWAWIQNQFGKKDIAKKILWNNFQTAHANVLKLKRVVFGLGHTPFSEIQPAYDALETFSNENEKKELNEKMTEVKKHVASLPQSHIMT